MGRFTKMVSVIGMLFVGLMGLSAPVYAAPVTVVAQSAQTQICNGVGLTGGNCSGGGASSQLNKVIAGAVNILSLIIGVAAVIMIMLAGFKFVTSGGDTSKVASAKSSLTYALVGIVVVALAQVLVHFVINKAG